MACEKRVDPIGPDAPCDLSGMDGNFELQKHALLRLIVCLLDNRKHSYGSRDPSL